MAATAVKVPSRSEPSKQLRPWRILWDDEAPCAAKNPARAFTGVPTGVEVGDASVLQTLTWRVPTVTRLEPIHAIWVMLLVHLLLAYRVADPFRLLMLHT